MPNELHESEHCMPGEARQRGPRERVDSTVQPSQRAQERSSGAAAKRSQVCQQNDAIPNVAHFIWFGDALPWVHRVALRSAARAGEFERVVLHYDSPALAHDFAELRELRGFDPRPIDVKGTFRGAGVDPVALARLYGRLSQPAARANLLRAAILAADGGVYLDMDTIAINSFRPLRDAEVFCGTERVAFPVELLRSGSLGQRARAYGLTALRDVMRRLPDGHRGFRRIENLYQKAPNNAVLGARPNHPFLLALLDGMLRLPARRQLQRYALGTHLLQDTVSHFRGSGLVVHPPELFYPLGPEISEHWFHLRRKVDLNAALAPETRLVHWYASVRTHALVPRIDPAYVLRNERRQLLSALLAPYARD
jgi:hypothetical protein